MKKIKAIIDTDPGVDDTTALVLSFFDPHIEIKLLTTVSGNIKVATATRNLCFLLDLFEKDFPVAKGATKAMNRVSDDASWLHGKQGLGSVVPPKTTTHQPLAQNAVEAMYDVLTQNPYQITIFVLGPHTNIANLIKKHPDAPELIKEIVFMGGSPYGHPDFPDHDSFNIKCDPEAFQIVLNSGIPLLMLPSNIGRQKAGLLEKDVKKVLNFGEVGKFFHKTYENYLEPNLLKQGLKVVATNDTCALYCKLYPSMFKTKKANLTVDLGENLGRTYADFCKNGAIDMVVDINKSKFLRKYFWMLKKLSKLKLNKKD